jgi:hypothetical protein
MRSYLKSDWENIGAEDFLTVGLRQAHSSRFLMLVANKVLRRCRLLPDDRNW